MKKIFAFVLIFVMLLSSACSKPDEQKLTEDTTDESLIVDNTSEDILKATDCEIIELASKTDFNKIYLDWGDYEIIVLPPIFTGIKIDEVYSYKEYYAFNSDGLVSVDYGENYYTVNKNGEIIDYAATSPVQSDKARQFKNTVSDGRMVSENTKIIQTGDGQRLHSLDGTPLSEYFDSISYFYNGLALAEKDNKIGIIDEKGTTLLEPSISFDKIKYPPEERCFGVQYMDGDAFIIPIGGELAVINIKRFPKLLDLDENTPKYEYTYNLDLNKPADKAYSEFIKNITDLDGYAIKDIDGSGTAELITKKYPDVTFYGYNGEVFEIGKISLTGTSRLLCSEDYPGIISFYVGGGANRYKYVTVKDGKLEIQDIWNDYYSYDGIAVTKRYEQFTDDKNLIKQSALAYSNNQDLVFNT